MKDHVLIHDDMVIFNPAFGPVMVAVQPGKLTASGPATLDGKKVCVEGDEKSVNVAADFYINPPYAIPTGKGTLTISALAGDQTAQKTKSGGKKVLMVGAGTFTAKFTVSASSLAPPKVPAPPEPDPPGEYSGTGTFMTTNTKLRGT